MSRNEVSDVRGSRGCNKRTCRITRQQGLTAPVGARLLLEASYVHLAFGIITRVARSDSWIYPDVDACDGIDVRASVDVLT
jgi:hypothetical protein